MKKISLSLAILFLLLGILAQAQDSVPRNAVLEALRENPPKLPESCRSPAYGPIQMEIAQSMLFLIGCDNELAHMIISPSREPSTLSSYRFSFDGNRYNLLVPGPIQGPAIELRTEISRLSARELNQLAGRLRTAGQQAE